LRRATFGATAAALAYPPALIETEYDRAKI
jgi:hypothetical protein